MRKEANLSPGPISYSVALLANVVRYYDYGLFGLSAGLISQELMPQGLSVEQQNSLFYIIFALSSAAKPLGSVIFGRIGDRYGRIYSIRFATVIAAISTTAVAFIPSFSSLAWWSVGLLMLFRILFLVSLAGEVDAIKLYIVETVAKRRRYLATSLIIISAQIGVLIASGAYFMALSVPQLPNLWRVNFVIGGIGGLIVVVLRKFLQHDQRFVKNSSLSVSVEAYPQLIKQNWFTFIIAIIVLGMLGGGYNFLIIFFSNFATKIVQVADFPLNANIILISLYMLASLIAGLITDWLKMNLWQTIAALLISILIIIILVQNYFTLHIFTWQLIAVLLVPFYSVPLTVKMQSLFRLHERMRLYSLAHSVGSLSFSSTAPVLGLLIYQLTNNYYYPIILFGLQLLALLMCSIILLKQKYVDHLEAD